MELQIFFRLFFLSLIGAFKLCTGLATLQKNVIPPLLLDLILSITVHKDNNLYLNCEAKFAVGEGRLHVVDCNVGLIAEETINVACQIG